MKIQAFFRRKPKLLSKFLIFGCILSVVPVVIFSLFCYVRVTRQITANTDMVEEKLLSSTQTMIERKLSHIDQSIYELSVLPSTMESLQLSVVKYNWTTFSNVNSLRRKINETQALIEKEGITASITLISELGDWVLDSSGFFQKGCAAHPTGSGISWPCSVLRRRARPNQAGDNPAEPGRQPLYDAACQRLLYYSLWYFSGGNTQISAF